MPTTAGPVTVAPPPMVADSRLLLAIFERWRQENESGGISVRWRRRHVWLAQLLQKLGRNVEVSAPLFFGERMRVVTGESVSRTLLTFGYSEQAITALMLHILEPRDRVVDIGTHFGYEAILAARLVGKQGQVTCFEPHPVTGELARKNLSSFSQCEVRSRAVGETVGTMRLRNLPVDRSAFNSLAIGGTDQDSVEVSVTTLDAEFPLGGPRIKFIKCDAEGFELSIIEGGRRMIREHAPVIVLEAEMPAPDTGRSARALQLGDCLAALGYTAFNFDYKGQLCVAPLGAMTVHHANVLFLPRSRPELFRLLGLNTTASQTES